MSTESESVNTVTAVETDVLRRIDASRERLVELLRMLVGFATPNPPGGNESEAQAWVADHLRSLGMDVEVFDALPGRPNVVGYARGGDGRSLLFNGHIDVAELRLPDAWTSPPYELREDGGRLYGAGSSDMKSAHAGFLLALECLQDAGVSLAGDVVYESVIGEESGEPGTVRCVERGIRADFAIVGECSSAESVIVSSVGAINLAITVRDASTYHLIQRRPRDGRSPLEAVNCLEKMATVVIPSLLQLEAEWGESKRHPLLPPKQSMINVFAIDTPANTFIIPNHCRAAFTVVYLPTETVEQVKAEVERHLDESLANDPWLREHPPLLEWNPAEFPIRFEPIDTPVDHPGVQLLATCLNVAGGRSPEVGGRDAIMDGGWLYQAGIPTVVFGPGDKRVIHAPNEYVKIDDVLAFSKTCALFALRWCGVTMSEQEN
jgi:formylaminopyrimidine deformylase